MPAPLLLPNLLQLARAHATSLLGPDRVTACGHDGSVVTGAGSSATVHCRARDGDDTGRHASSSPLSFASKTAACSSDSDSCGSCDCSKCSTRITLCRAVCVVARYRNPSHVVAANTCLQRSKTIARTASSPENKFCRWNAPVAEAALLAA